MASLFDSAHVATCAECGAESLAPLCVHCQADEAAFVESAHSVDLLIELHSFSTAVVVEAQSSPFKPVRRRADACSGVR